MIHHMAQSVRGALRHWGLSQWKALAKDNKMTVEQVKEYFKIKEFEGVEVIP